MAKYDAKEFGMSADMRRRHWAQAGEETFVLGIWLLYGIHQLFGRWPFRICVYPVVAMHWLMRPDLRAASMQYLQRLEVATGALGHMPTRRDSLRHVLLFSETILDKLLAVSGKYKKENVDTKALSTLLNEVQEGRGGVIVTAHLGCLELCREMAQRGGVIRLNILLHTQHAEQFNKILKRFNSHNNLRLIEVTEITPATAILLAECVADGEFVVTSGDRVPIFSDNVVSAPFLGHMASFPVGPYVLTSLLKCPLYLLACTHAGKGYAVHLEKLAERIELPRGNRQAAMTGYAEIYVRALTAILKKSPYDWFNFFPFWDQGNAKH